MLETASNQAYIFASNRQREQVGASHLIAASTTSWLLDALPAGSHPLAGQGGRGQELASLLSDGVLNPNLDEADGVELLTVTSGKSLLSCHDAELARSVVAGVTHRALRDAPGLTVRGVTVTYGDGSTGTRDLTDAVAQAHRSMASVRASVPSESWRMRQDPLTAICADSGMPATRLRRAPGGDRPVPRSAASVSKQDAARSGYQRMRRLLGSAIEAGHLSIPESSEERDELRRTAVLHADGNSIGRLFASLPAIAASAAGGSSTQAERRFIDLVRDLSSGLDEVTRRSLLEALEVAAVRRGGPIELLPLIVGGDDVTVIVDAPAAWDLATAYLAAFERISADREGPLGPVLRRLDELPADGEPLEQVAAFRSGLTASAGFALVPSSYPFHAAYDLAEAATASAKQAKNRAELSSGRPVSAVDFHVHYDRGGDDLARLRAGRRGGEGANEIDLSGGPYLLLEGRDDEVAIGARNDGWSPPQLRRRDLSRISAWRAALSPATVDEGARGSRLSRTTVRRLREALLGGTETWRSARRFLRPEQAEELAALEEAHLPLLIDDGEGMSTVLLDVLELIGAELVGEER